MLAKRFGDCLLMKFNPSEICRIIKVKITFYGAICFILVKKNSSYT